jgi:hypothetical protein
MTVPVPDAGAGVINRENASTATRKHRIIACSIPLPRALLPFPGRTIPGTTQYPCFYWWIITVFFSLHGEIPEIFQGFLAG